MQISSRFTIALHIFACIHTFEGEHKITSDFLATSINVNPVIIRRVLQQLKANELVHVVRGSGGAAIAKPVENISLFDIYNAVEVINKKGLFHFHEHPSPDCSVGKNIHQVLDGKLDLIQKAMEDQMKAMSLQEVITDIDHYVAINP
ncbi:Rrf2 family transcriptional regulator [Lactococcus garvieae]|uniref:Rrf2 family transcriptional regulator n=2 Tax=Lactococcus garvieae TaxID=1363 RepID=F9VDJ7_LACGL|nr:Rrf2 family transcriptional regulator [Lactococcus garvieae]ETD05771.1 transcriptional regulator [Lactococcus garvieae TRF1]EOT33491.1 hypothetical protein OO3_00683 [Lactococcus garvieae ATCC 49156]EOT93530.1 hypothetical protein I578_01068 [Lactococcus garvieae ATCC 49156]QSR01076.1 Rrf2 family transcriptional regulator [Lactococcus garvieae]BAK58430.1 conserved hypothetical protein [Lactococcus garvieae ATCC 49156]